MEEYSLSREERKLMRWLYDNQPQELLDYPLKDVKAANGEIIHVYDIPECEKEEVFQKLYPFCYPPKMTEELLDIHEDKTFKVYEFLVVRDGEYNYMVSPYYASKGGTVLDWKGMDNPTATIFIPKGIEEQ